MPQLPYNPVAAGGQPGSASQGFQRIDGVAVEAFGGAQGRAIQSFGQEFGKTMNVVIDIDNAMKRENAESDIVKLSQDFFARQETDLIERQRTTTGDATGFTQRYMENFNRERERLLATVQDPVRRNAIDARLAPSVREFARRAFQSQLQLQDTFEGADLDTGTGNMARELLQSGGADFEARQARMIERVNASRLPEHVKAARIAALRESAATAAAYGIMQTNPAGLAAATGGTTPYLSELERRESSNRPNAQNPNSSATGLGQFINSTWGVAGQKDSNGNPTGLANTPAGRAAGLRPIPADGIRGPNDPRFDVEQQRIATRLFTEQNAQDLRAANLPDGPQELYLAHFLGAGGAVNFLRRMIANPQAPAADGNAAAADKNPTIFYTPDGRARTNAQMFQHLTGSFANTPHGGAVNPAIINQIPPNQFALIRDRSELQARQQATAATTAQNNQIWQQENQALVQLNDGVISRAALTGLREQGLFSDINRLQQFENIAARQEAGFASLNRFMEMSRSGTPGSGLVQADRDAAEAGLQAMVRTGRVSAFEAIPQVVAATGVMPASGVTAIRAGLNSNDINQVRQAYNAMELVMGAGARPDMLQGIANGDELKTMFSTLQAIRSTAGSTEVADQLMMRHIQQVNSPEWASFRQYRDGLAQDEIKRTQQEPAKVIDDIRKALGVGFAQDIPVVGGLFNPVVRSTPTEEARMLQDYRTIYADMVGRSGNPEAAKKQTLELMRETWGISRSPDGTRRIMKFAVETRYPPNPFNANDPHGYVYENARERLLQMGVNVPTGQIFLLPVIGTDRQFREQGGVPQYRITYRDAAGFMQAGPVFERFDPQTVFATQRELRSVEEDRARNRLEAPMNPVLDGSVMRPHYENRLSGGQDSPIPRSVPQPAAPPPRIRIQRYNRNPLE